MLRGGDHDGATKAFQKAQKLGGEFADGGEKGGVDGASVEKERTENFEDAAFVGNVEGGGDVGHKGELCFGTKIGFLPWVRGMLWFCGRGMLEAV